MSILDACQTTAVTHVASPYNASDQERTNGNNCNRLLGDFVFEKQDRAFVSREDI